MSQNTKSNDAGGSAKNRTSIPPAAATQGDALEDVSKTGKALVIPLGLSSVVIAASVVVFGIMFYLIQEQKAESKNATVDVRVLSEKMARMEGEVKSLREIVDLKDKFYSERLDAWVQRLATQKEPGEAHKGGAGTEPSIEAAYRPGHVK